MKFDVCKDDIHALRFSWMLCVMAELFVYYACAWNRIVMFIFLTVDILLVPSIIKDYLYLSRAISFDQEGCIFCRSDKEVKILWKDLNVLLIDKERSYFNGGDLSGPGILICPKHTRYAGFLAPMTFCRFKCPGHSVYLRFRPEKEIGPWDSGKSRYYGYVVERDDITAYFDLIGLTYIRFRKSK